MYAVIALLQPKIADGQSESDGDQLVPNLQPKALSTRK